MKVQVNVLINTEINPEDFLEEDEVLVGSEEYENDEEGLDAVTEEMVMERYRDQIDEGSESLDDLLQTCDDYTVTVSVADEDGKSHLWTEKLSESQVAFMNSLIEQIPVQFGAREAFVNTLQKLAEAR